MNWTNFIRTLGHDEPSSMLDPAAYSDEEIEEDLIEINLGQQQARNKVTQKGNQYDAKLDEAAQAPEWMEEELLLEADEIEQEKKDWQDEWRQYADKKRLVKSVQSFRRRINASEQDLNIDQLRENEGNQAVRSELQESLKDHMRSQNQVEELLQLFTNSRDLDRSNTSGRSRNLEKHRKRLEARKNGSSQSGPGERDDNQSRSPASSDD